MSFTLLSIALILVVGAGIFIEVRRGLGRGFVRTAVTLASVLVSALGAIGLSVWLSDKPADKLCEFIGKKLPILDNFSKFIAHVDDILLAAVDALLTPVLFVAFFVLLRLLSRVVLSVLFRSCWKQEPDDPCHAGTAARPNALITPNYESPDAPWHRRHDRLLGGITGGICGFMATLFLLSPVLGILSTAGTLLRGLDSMNVSLKKMGFSDGQVAMVEPYVHDSAVAVLGAMGGDLTFDAVSTTTLNGRTVSLRREVETCMDVCMDFNKVIKVVTRPAQATDEQKRILCHLGSRMDESEITRLLAADCLNGAATAWMKGEKYMNLSRPVCGEILDPLMDKALLVCADSTPDCAGRDITTILNVYLIAVENGLTDNPDREELMAALKDGGVMDQIYAELRKNPCMAHLCDELSNTALRLMASAIDWANLSPEVYRDLMDNLSEAMNFVNGMEGAAFTEQVDAMTRYTLHYAEQYGIDLPESMAKMAATAMVEQLSGSGKLDADKLDEFFHYYLKGK